MRFATVAASLLLAGLPFALAAPQMPPAAGAAMPGPGVNADAADTIMPTQMQDITDRARNTTGSLTSVIDGTLMAISPARLQGSAGLMWDTTAVSGAWSFGTPDKGKFSGGWTTNGKMYEHNGGVAIMDGKVALDTKVVVHDDGSIEVTLNAGSVLRCDTETVDQKAGGPPSKSTTVCRSQPANKMA